MVRRMSIFVFTVLLLCLLLAETVSAGQIVTNEDRDWARSAIIQEKAIKGGNASGNSLAVLYFINVTGEPSLDLVRKGLTYMLISDFSKVKGFQVVERTKLQALIEEMGLGKSGILDPATSSQVGHMLKAAYVVGGEFRNFRSEKFQIDPGIINISAQKNANLSDSEGLLAEIFRMEKEVLFNALEYLEKKPKSAAVIAELRKPMTTHLDALLFFFNGLNESDQGNYQAAAGCYRNALKADPHFKAAADCLKEIGSLGMIVTESAVPVGASAPPGVAAPHVLADAAHYSQKFESFSIDSWQNIYTAALKKGKATQIPSAANVSDGLAYTPSEGTTLQTAISQALEQDKKARSCECLKIAVDLDYNPYIILKTIYEEGGQLEIDELCMCATEAGIKKAIIAKAAKEAVSPLGKPLYMMDEIARANCFREGGGLAYTEAESSPEPIPVDPTPGPGNEVSRYKP